MSYGRAYGTNGFNQLDVQSAPNYDQGEARRKCVKRCLWAFMCLLLLLLLVLLFEVASVNVINSGNYKNVNRDNYLLLPVNTIVKLPVDADKYGSIAFSSDSSDRDGSNAPMEKGYKKVKFITRAYENGTAYGGHGIVSRGKCVDSTCLITRYWPLDGENYQGFFSCSNPWTQDGKIVWEWFDHRMTFNDLPVSCPSSSTLNTYFCQGNFGVLYVSQIFDRYGPHNGHHLLIIFVCDARYINFIYNFNEPWPALLYSDYDVYTFIGPQKQGHEYKATIPLQAEVDSAVYIAYEPVPYPRVLNDSDHLEYVTIRYDLIQNAYHHATVWTSIRERVNSVFVVISIFVICTALIFVMYYIRKNFVIL